MAIFESTLDNNKIYMKKSDNRCTIFPPSKLMQISFSSSSFLVYSVSALSSSGKLLTFVELSGVGRDWSGSRIRRTKAEGPFLSV